MKAFTITNKDVYNILQSSTIDRYYTELFTKAVSCYNMQLYEHIYTCFCHYLAHYVKLNDLNLDIHEHNRVYDNFACVANGISSRDFDSLIEHNNFYGNSTTPRSMHFFDHDVLQVNIVDSIIGTGDTDLFGKYHSKLYDDTYDMIKTYYSSLEGGNVNVTKMDDTIIEEMEVVVSLIKLVIEQIESRILNQRSETPACYVLFGMQEQNMFVLVH